MIIEITVPESLMPKKDPENPCPCQSRPMKLKDKKGEIFWLVNEGDSVKKNQVICEGEVEKKTVEFPSPADGVLIKICIPDEGKFKIGDVVGLLEV